MVDIITLPLLYFNRTNAAPAARNLSKKIIMQKTKRSYGKGKTKRKNFLFTEQITGMLEDTAGRLGMSENELVATCVFDVISDRSKFIICPNCKNYVFYKQLLPVANGVAEFDCKCGNHIWYDVDADKILKSSVMK